MRISLVRIAQGEKFPRGWGLARWERNYDSAIILPIPFNLAVRAWDTVADWVRAPSEAPLIIRREAQYHEVIARITREFDDYKKGEPERFRVMLDKLLDRWEKKS